MKEEIPTPQEIMDFISASAKDAKYAWCKDSEGMADTPPMLMGQFPDGAGFMMPDLSEGHPTDHLPEMLSALLEAMEEKNGKKKAPALGDWGVQFWPVGIRRP